MKKNTGEGKGLENTDDVFGISISFKLKWFVFPPSLLPFLNKLLLLILLFHQTAFLRDSFQSVRLFPMMHLFWPKSMPGPNQDEEVWEGVVEKLSRKLLCKI